MPENLNALLSGAWRDSSTPLGSGELDALLARVERGTSRRRAVRAVETFAVSAAAAGVIGAGVWAAAGRTDGRVQAPPLESPTAVSTDGTQNATATPSPESPTATPTVAQVLRWADVPTSDYPPVVTDQDPREPTARVLEDWVWDYVGPGWSLGAWHTGDGPMADNQMVDAQALFLVAPDGVLFRHSTLRTDTLIVLEAWEPRAGLAWMDRYSGGDGWQTIEYDLRAKTVDENWAGSISGPKQALPRAWRGDDQLWLALDYKESPTGLFWRDARTGAIRESDLRATLGATYGASSETRVSGWLDPDRERAVWITQLATDTPSPQRWWLQDLSDGTMLPLSPLLPAEFPKCTAIGDQGSDWVLAWCAPEDGQLLVAPGGEVTADSGQRFAVYLDGVTPPALRSGTFPDEALGRSGLSRWTATTSGTNGLVKVLPYPEPQ